MIYNSNVTTIDNVWIWIWTLDTYFIAHCDYLNVSYVGINDLIFVEWFGFIILIIIRLRSDEPNLNLLSLTIDHWPCMAIGNGRW